MTSVNLEKTLGYLEIQESLRSGNLSIIYAKEEFYMFFSILKGTTEVKEIFELGKTLWLFALKTFQRNALRSMLMSMPADSSFEHSEGSQRALRYLGTWRALGGHQATWTLKALRHLSTWALRHWGIWVLRSLVYLGTRALQAFEHSGTRGTLFSRLPKYPVIISSSEVQFPFGKD